MIPWDTSTRKLEFDCLELGIFSLLRVLIASARRLHWYFCQLVFSIFGPRPKSWDGSDLVDKSIRSVILNMNKLFFETAIFHIVNFIVNFPFIQGFSKSQSFCDPWNRPKSVILRRPFLGLLKLTLINPIDRKAFVNSLPTIFYWKTFFFSICYEHMEFFEFFKTIPNVIKIATHADYLDALLWLPLWMLSQNQRW